METPMAASKNPTHEPIASCPAAASEAPMFRDQIAVAAMQAILGTFSNGGMSKGGAVIIAAGAYLMADAMIQARAGLDRASIIRAIGE
jgi:hypothetical protein